MSRFNPPLYLRIPRLFILFLIFLVPIEDDAQLVKSFSEFTGDVLSVAFSPDGKYLAYGSGDRAIHLWDRKNGDLVTTFDGHTDGVRSVAFSPDGKYLVSGSWDKSVRLWSIKTGHQLKILSGHTKQVFSVAFSPDGKYVASGSEDNTVRIWSLPSGNLIRTFFHPDRVFSVAFSEDGKYLASGCSDHLIRLWDLDTGSLAKTFYGHSNSVICVSFSPDGWQLASGSSDHSIRIWDIATGMLVKTLSGHLDLVSSLAYSPDSKNLVSGSFDNTVRLWDLQSGSLVKTFSLHLHPVLSVAFSPDGKYVASGSEDKSVQLWEVAEYIAEKSDPKFPPYLAIKENSISFSDTNGNDRLDAGEIATVEFVLVNKGTGTARGLRVVAQLMGDPRDITVVPPSIPPIIVGAEQTITTILRAGGNVQTGKALLRLVVTEPNGLDSKPVEVEFSTLAFQPPKVVAADGIFSSESGGKLKSNYPANLEVLVQNTGTGDAEDITAEVRLPDNVLSLDPPHQPIVRLRPGESVRMNAMFIVTARYYALDVPIKIVLKEKHGKYGSEKTFTARIDQPLETARVSIQSEDFKTTTVVMASLHSEVDREIPINTNQHSNRFALVVGNEDYQRFQTGLQVEQNVAFARNDAIVFKEYLVKELGFPEKQVFLLTDATRGQMGRELERLVELAKLNPGAELVFYYAGHGLPEEDTKQAYIIPVDVTASSVTEGIRLSDLYKKLASAQPARVTVFLDACFSGGGRGENGLLAARTVKIKPKGDLVEGNVIVFAAASGDEVSLPFNKESHGLFTYCLLHKLKETKGNLTMNELRNYLEHEVPTLSLLENSQKQTPQMLVAPDLGDSWLNWKWQ